MVLTFADVASNGLQSRLRISLRNLFVLGMPSRIYIGLQLLLCPIRAPTNPFHAPEQP